MDIRHAETTEDGFAVLLIYEPEHMTIDQAFDNSPHSLVREVKRNVANGKWEFFQVTVEARKGAAVGRAYLGGCVYASPQDFLSGGYWEQLKAEAVEEARKG